MHQRVRSNSSQMLTADVQTLQRQFAHYVRTLQRQFARYVRTRPGGFEPTLLRPTIVRSSCRRELRQLIP
eukprot:720397-Pyramimonas_sp.AAC.1